MLNFKKTMVCVAVMNGLSVSAPFAASISITTLTDGASDKCTLRDALRSVNSGSNKGSCVALGEFGNSDTIRFQASRGTIRLESVDSYGINFSTPTLYINKDVEINPGGSDITIIGASDPGPILSVGGSYVSPIEATVNNIEFRGGSSFSGGAVRVGNAKLELFNSSITGGKAARGAGIYVDFGALVLQDSSITKNSASKDDSGVGGDGGAVYLKSSSLSMNRSTVSGNTAVSGAGIAAYESTVTVSNSTISNNVAQEYGGGLVSYSSRVTFLNSTLSGNRAADGGGVAFATTNAILRNTIIANSSANDCLNLFGSVSAAPTNIIEDGSCETSALRGDPSLGPLADNGGQTSTHTLNSNSIAIDNGNAAQCPNEDQRGLLRNDGRCDIGAFELGALEPVQSQSIILAPIFMLLED